MGISEVYLWFFFFFFRVQKERVSEREKDLELLQEKLAERVSFLIYIWLNQIIMSAKKQKINKAWV